MWGLSCLPNNYIIISVRYCCSNENLRTSSLHGAIIRSSVLFNLALVVSAFLENNKTKINFEVTDTKSIMGYGLEIPCMYIPFLWVEFYGEVVCSDVHYCKTLHACRLIHIQPQTSVHKTRRLPLHKTRMCSMQLLLLSVSCVVCIHVLPEVIAIMAQYSALLLLILCRV